MKTWTTSSGCTITKVLSGRSNVFLLTNSSSAILIDSGIGLMWSGLRDRLLKLGIQHIDYLVLTHAHFDHVNNAKKIVDNFGAKVIIHEAEAEYLAKGEMVMISSTNAFIRQMIKTLSGFTLMNISCRPCPYYLTFKQRFDLDQFGFNAYIMHTPGHSQGSASIIVDNEIAIVGDAMFGVLPWSVYPPFLQDEKQLVESWRKLLETGCDLFLPSHGSGSSRKLLTRNYLHYIKV
ncbi:MAG TPA: MBL fold metallo-hydrolase [Bacteroidales bacterium]|jgi:glyoxylase-like metal-dependent hydrolase (beta-lactamase superfamily II)|nr:MBL fold metallo-hydrolase [Bacteroidales bacterium]